MDYSSKTRFICSRDQSSNEDQVHMIFCFTSSNLDMKCPRVAMHDMYWMPTVGFIKDLQINILMNS